MGLVLSVLVGGVLAGCAAPGGSDLAKSSSSESANPTAGSSADAQAEAKAQSWIDGAVLPPGAVLSSEKPLAAGGYGDAIYRWWCSPMELREAYWTVPGATVAETATFLSEHPTADLIVTLPFREFEGDVIHTATVPNAPTQDSLEGIIYTVAQTKDGVAIRSLVGVIPESAVCPTPDPGTSLGGPGQG